MIELTKVADENPTVDVFQCGGELWDHQGDVPVFIGYRGVRADMVSTLTPVEFFWQTNHGLGLLVRREALLYVGGASAGYVSVDGDLICKLVEADCRLAYVDICLYRWHIFDHSGFRKLAAISRDNVMFNIRLGNWNGVLRQEPKAFAAALRWSNLPNMDGFLVAVVLLVNVIFCPLWVATRRLRAGLALIRRKLRPRASATASKSPLDGATPLFTGTLAVIRPRATT
jgi:hypothetical protein